MLLPPAPPPRRILVTRLRFIGDVVLTTPVIRALRGQYPDAEIVYLAERGPAGIIEGHPGLDEVMILDREGIDRRPVGSRLRARLRFLKDLRSRRFDMVIDLFGNPRSALLTLLTGARIRVGYDVRGRGAVYNVKIRRSSSLRVVDAYLDAVRTLGLRVDDDRTEIVCGVEEQAWAAAWLGRRGLADHRRIVGLNPGASWPAKRWGVRRFASLGDRLVAGHEAAVLLVYGPGQRPLVEEVAARMHHAPFIVDMAPLRRLAALIRRCRVFVSNDCGPMHIAAAVGTPAVGIFGPSRPGIWFPYAEEDGHTALAPGDPDCCRRDICTRPVSCITAIPVDAVVGAVTRAFEAGRDG